MRDFLAGTEVAVDGTVVVAIAAAESVIVAELAAVVCLHGGVRDVAVVGAIATDVVVVTVVC